MLCSVTGPTSVLSSSSAASSCSASPNSRARRRWGPPTPMQQTPPPPTRSSPTQPSTQVHGARQSPQLTPLPPQVLCQLNTQQPRAVRKVLRPVVACGLSGGGGWQMVQGLPCSSRVPQPENLQPPRALLPAVEVSPEWVGGGECTLVSPEGWARLHSARAHTGDRLQPADSGARVVSAPEATSSCLWPVAHLWGAGGDSRRGAGGDSRRGRVEQAAETGVQNARWRC